jgi:hypothetical protein
MARRFPLSSATARSESGRALLAQARLLCQRARAIHTAQDRLAWQGLAPAKISEAVADARLYVRCARLADREAGQAGSRDYCRCTPAASHFPESCPNRDGAR